MIHRSIPGRDGEVLGVLRHRLEGTADRLERAEVERLEVGVQAGPLVVRLDTAEGNATGAVARGRVLTPALAVPDVRAYRASH